MTSFWLLARQNRKANNNPIRDPRAGMVVISLRVYHGFWCHSRCSGRNATIVNVSFRKREKNALVLFKVYYMEVNFHPPPP